MRSDIYDIVIYGGGHTAAFLKAMFKSLRILALMPSETYAYDLNRAQRLFAISKGSINIISSFIDESKLLNLGQPINKIKVSEGDSGHELEFCTKELQMDNFGLMIREDELLNLFEQGADSNLISKNGTIKAIEDHQGYTKLILEDGSDVVTSLLLSADGKHSRIRKLIGLEIYSHDYHQYGLVCEVRHQNNHFGTAVEKFLPSGPFAILPRKGGYESSIVWTVEKSWRKPFEALSQELQHQLIKKQFPVEYMDIEIASSISFFPLNQQLADPPYMGRTLLVGDAAHSMHPLAGQGFNLTIRDLSCLQEFIEQYYGLGLDIGSHQIMEQYQKARKHDIDLLLEATHQLNGIFSNSSKIISLARGLGLDFVDRIKILKRYCANYAVYGNLINN